MSKQSEKDEQMKRGEDLQRLTDSKEWGLVEEKFWKHINDMQSIMNIDPSENIEVELKARKTAVDYMMDLWRDINGDVEQHQMRLNNELETKQPGQFGSDVDYGNDDNFIQRSDST